MSRWISIAASIIVGIAIAVLLAIGPKTGNVENLRDVLLSYGPWAVGISAGLMVAQAIVAPLPANVITITNGLIFGPIWGGLLSYTTTLMGASLCFLLSRSFGKPFAEKIVGRSVHRAERFFKRYGLHAMFLVRIIPFVPFDAVSYGAGLVGVPFTRFLLATGVGIIPSVAVYSYLGTMIAGIYWWVLLGLLTVSLIAILIAARVLRKTARTAPALSKTPA
jgi:uncharacterized membrane protein YdjX (TVP38/TMEM64 family)